LPVLFLFAGRGIANGAAFRSGAHRGSRARARDQSDATIAASVAATRRVEVSRARYRERIIGFARSERITAGEQFGVHRLQPTRNLAFSCFPIVIVKLSAACQVPAVSMTFYRHRNHLRATITTFALTTRDLGDSAETLQKRIELPDNRIKV